LADSLCSLTKYAFLTYGNYGGCNWTAGSHHWSGSEEEFRALRTGQSEPIDELDWYFYRHDYAVRFLDNRLEADYQLSQQLTDYLARGRWLDKTTLPEMLDALQFASKAAAAFSVTGAIHGTRSTVEATKDYVDYFSSGQFFNDVNKLIPDRQPKTCSYGPSPHAGSTPALCIQ
jgi:hypothetical protein